MKGGAGNSRVNQFWLRKTGIKRRIDGKMSFIHTVQIHDTLFIPILRDWHEDVGDSAAFVTGCFLAFYFVSVRANRHAT